MLTLKTSQRDADVLNECLVDLPPCFESYLETGKSGLTAIATASNPCRYLDFVWSGFDENEVWAA